MSVALDGEQFGRRHSWGTPKAIRTSPACDLSIYFSIGQKLYIVKVQRCRCGALYRSAEYCRASTLRYVEVNKFGTLQRTNLNFSCAHKRLRFTPQPSDLRSRLTPENELRDYRGKPHCARFVSALGGLIPLGCSGNLLSKHPALRYYMPCFQRLVEALSRIALDQLVKIALAAAR